MTTMIAELKGKTREQKPSEADTTWKLLSAMYEDASRAHTQGRLAQLGMGVKGNSAPIEVGVVRRVVDRLAVTYDKAPARFLSRNRKRIAESRAEHVNMIDFCARSQYDLVWDQVDKKRSLLRQVAIRFYPSKQRSSFNVQVFTPDNILRDPSGAEPDTLDEDRAFALKLSASGGHRETWELWRKSRKDGLWRVMWINEQGQPLSMEHQVFRTGVARDELGFISPYDNLPVQMVYDEIPLGRAWLNPRQSRAAFNDALNAVMNDLLALVQLQAHAREIFKTDNPNATLPPQRGPGTSLKIPVDSTLEYETPSPNIADCLETLQQFERVFTLSEDLPTSELSPDKTILTGAALKVEERPLAARRRKQIPLAHQDERLAWGRGGSVLRVHAVQLGITPPPKDLEMVVELAEPDQPTERGDVLEDGAKGIALGVESTIDVLQRLHGCTRSEAIERYERIKADKEAYPPLGNPGAQQEGPRMTNVDATPTELDRALGATGDQRAAPRADLGNADSVMQAISGS